MSKLKPKYPQNDTDFLQDFNHKNSGIVALLSDGIDSAQNSRRPLHLRVDALIHLHDIDAVVDLPVKDLHVHAPGLIHGFPKLRVLLRLGLEALKGIRRHAQELKVEVRLALAHCRDGPRQSRALAC